MTPSSPASAPRSPRVPPVSRVSSMKAPSRIEIIRSAVAAIRESCVTMTSVCPATCRLSNSRSTSSVAALSRLPVGSSASTTRGSLASARAIATRWRWPPDSAVGRNLARSASPTRSISSVARRRAARAGRPASSAGNSTFSTAVSSSIRWKAWKTNPTASWRSRARARSLIWSTRLPASRTSPPDGRSSPPSRCSRVDFPQPLGPMMATVSPAATSRSTPSTARTRPASFP